MKYKTPIAQNRDLLDSMIGQEGFFLATVSRPGTHDGAVKFLLHNIKADGRKPLADHMWVGECKALVEAQVRPGDCIEFHAKIVSYVTGFGHGDIPHCSATFDEIRDVKKIMQKGLYY